MKKDEILAHVICKIQEGFVSNSFYDDDNTRTHKNVSGIGFIQEHSGKYSDLIGLCGLVVSLEDAETENLKEEYVGSWSGRVEIVSLKEQEVKVMLLSKSGPYSYCGPFILFYKIKGE